MVSYGCRVCGYATSRWLGFCPQCKTASALEERAAAPGRSGVPGGPATVPITAAVGSPNERLVSGIDEFDRVLGGGFVPGGVVLLGGEPGVGKSTLLLEVAASLADQGGSTLLVSSEESVAQIGLRAQRIGAARDGVSVASLSEVSVALDEVQRVLPDLLIVDSIQALSTSDTVSGTGAAARVREAAARLIRHAKAGDVATVLVGHVTKDGAIAGPKLLEHMVDVVVSLEGAPDRGLRFLRSSKNRFGSVNEVGVFTMEDRGLVPVPDPSGALLAGRDPGVSGSVMFPTIDGRRSLVVEVQALAVGTRTSQPRRSVTGLAPARVHQLLAVLERHANIRLSGCDVYVSVIGGLRIREPAADLAVAVALASALVGVPVGRVAAFGEVGLTGELRSVSQAGRRRAEAKRLGVKSIVSPDGTDRLLDALVASGIGPRRRRPPRAGTPTLNLVR
jgi:DNA repair protein RadA/Sms